MVKYPGLLLKAREAFEIDRCLLTIKGHSYKVSSVDLLHVNSKYNKAKPPLAPSQSFRSLKSMSSQEELTSQTIEDIW